MPVGSHLRHIRRYAPAAGVPLDLLCSHPGMTRPGQDGECFLQDLALFDLAEVECAFFHSFCLFVEVNKIVKALNHRSSPVGSLREALAYTFGRLSSVLCGNFPMGLKCLLPLLVLQPEHFVWSWCQFQHSQQKVVFFWIEGREKSSSSVICGLPF